MLFKGHARIRRTHPDAIINHLDKLTTCLTQNNLNLRGMCINAVFEQLLNDAGRTLHDFARCNLISDRIREEMDNIH